jgi:hypothetical protein
MNLLSLFARTRWLRIGIVILVLAVVYTRRGCYSEPAEIETEELIEIEPVATQDDLFRLPTASMSSGSSAADG